MSYIIEQKIKGRIYLYKVESYWDKEKKQARQKRVYIGPKEKPIPVANLKSGLSGLITKNYGNILFFNHIVEEIGLEKVIKASFPYDYREILALAYYEIMEASPGYLFHYWLEEQNLKQVRSLHSADISNLYDSIGKNQSGRQNFTRDWIENLKPIQGIYYDITSVSSYSTKIDFVEWGYNRDGENLPQINIGMVCCQKSGLPIFYNVFPGSIVDVTTIKNFIKFLKVYGLEDLLLIMDRGFFSSANLSGLANSGTHTKFLQPLSFSLKKAKELVKQNRKELMEPTTAFKYNEEIIHHLLVPISFDAGDFHAHIFLNEKAELDQRHVFLSGLLDAELKFKDIKFKTLEEFQSHMQLMLPDKYRPFFKFDKKNQAIVKDNEKIKEYISKLGYFIIITNVEGLRKDKVLDYYRDKDKVEKIFDIVKNEMDGDRVRSHSQYNAEGKLFVKYIALIVYMQITRVMREHNLFEKFSIHELLRELKKIKISYLNDHDPIISEISKKQKLILDAFSITYDFS